MDNKQPLASGSYLMTSHWRKTSKCQACRASIGIGDHIYWSPRFPKAARCAACGDYPPPPTPATVDLNTMVTAREIDWLRSLARVTFSEVN